MVQLWDPKKDYAEWCETTKKTSREFSDSDVLLGSTIAFLVVFAGIAFVKPQPPDWVFLAGGVVLGLLTMRLQRAASEAPGSIRVVKLAVMLAATLAGIAGPLVLGVFTVR